MGPLEGWRLAFEARNGNRLSSRNFDLITGIARRLHRLEPQERTSLLAAREGNDLNGLDADMRFQNLLEPREINCLGPAIWRGLAMLWVR